MQVYRHIGKRAFDLVLATTILVAAAPALIGIAVAIRCTLGSPVLFRQRRVGQNGRQFWLYKYRTMTHQLAPNGELAPDEERLTRFGCWLRRSSLDELPELWNVLTGEMSLVGPRPLLPAYLPLYTHQEKRRHEVLPGLTGWAQVNGRNGISWERKFELDVQYVDRLSWTLDLIIIVRTLICVMRQHGVNAADHATMPCFTGHSDSPLPARTM